MAVTVVRLPVTVTPRSSRPVTATSTLLSHSVTSSPCSSHPAVVVVVLVLTVDVVGAGDMGWGLSMEVSEGRRGGVGDTRRGLIGTGEVLVVVVVVMVRGTAGVVVVEVLVTTDGKEGWIGMTSGGGGVVDSGGMGMVRGDGGVDEVRELMVMGEGRAGVMTGDDVGVVREVVRAEEVPVCIIIPGAREGPGAGLGVVMVRAGEVPGKGEVSPGVTNFVTVLLRVHEALEGGCGDEGAST